MEQLSKSRWLFIVTNMVTLLLDNKAEMNNEKSGGGFMLSIVFFCSCGIIVMVIYYENRLY